MVRRSIHAIVMLRRTIFLDRWLHFAYLKVALVHLARAPSALF
jgi:hypothetical protein